MAATNYWLPTVEWNHSVWINFEPFDQTLQNLSELLIIEWVNKILKKNFRKRYDFQDGGQKLQTILALIHSVYITFEPFDQTLQY